MLLIIPILLFVILCLCLPQLMMQILIGTFGYVTCRILSKINMAKMIIIITLFSCLSVIMEKVMPIIEEEQKKQEYVENKIKDANKIINPNSKLYNKEDIQKPIDKILEDNIPDNLITRILQEYPRTR